MRALWLADVLRRAGLTVHEYSGWRTRGASTYGPVRGIICHGTAGSPTSTDAGELRVLVEGSATAAPPIAQLYLSRSGAWWVVASGTCTGVKTGTAGPLKGYSDDAVLQIEAQHASTEPWTETQYRSYVRGIAALAAHRAPGYDVPVSRVVGHYEHQPREKTDPWFDMNRFRADVAAVMAGDGMANIDQRDWDHLRWRVYDGIVAGNETAAGPADLAGKQPIWIVRAINKLAAAAAADETRDAATLAAIQALAAGGTGVDTTLIMSKIAAEANATRDLVEQRHAAEMAELAKTHAEVLHDRDARIAALRAELAELGAGQ